MISLAYRLLLFGAMLLIVVMVGRHLELDTLERFVFSFAGGFIAGVIAYRWESR